MTLPPDSDPLTSLPHLRASTDLRADLRAGLVMLALGAALPWVAWVVVEVVR